MVTTNEHNQATYDELDSLANEYLEGTLSDEKGLRLQELLSDSSELRNRYLNFIHTVTLTEQALMSNPMVEKPQPKPLASVKPLPSIRTSQTKLPSQSSGYPALAAAAVIIGIVAISLFFTSSPTSLKKADNLTSLKKADKLTFKTSEGTLFTLTHDSSLDQSPSGQSLAPGSRLQLTQGSAELTFESGVTSIVMAPADLTLRQHGNISLDHGKAWFHVPHEAIGFTVQTKDLNVVDLGTNFGVNATPQQTLAEVHVFKGKVRASACDGKQESTELTAHQAIQLAPEGSLKPIPFKPNAFFTTLPETLPYLHWSFDGTLKVTGNHPDLSDIQTSIASIPSKQHQPNIKPTYTEGIRGKAISFDGTSNYLTSNWPCISGNSPRTISFWLKLPSGWKSKTTQGLIGWGDHNLNFGKWSLLVRSPHKKKHTSSAQLILSLNNKGLAISNKPLTLGQWHHIVASYSGLPDKHGQYQTEIYIDGTRVKMTTTKQWANNSMQAQTATHTPNAQPLSIGTTIRPNSLANRRSTLKGMIDELTIFEGHMTESQIQRLAK